MDETKHPLQTLCIQLTQNWSTFRCAGGSRRGRIEALELFDENL
jgi:hypothetical protein